MQLYCYVPVSLSFTRLRIVRHAAEMRDTRLLIGRTRPGKKTVEIETVVEHWLSLDEITRDACKRASRDDKSPRSNAASPADSFISRKHSSVASGNRKTATERGRAAVVNSSGFRKVRRFLWNLARSSYPRRAACERPRAEPIERYSNVVSWKRSRKKRIAREFARQPRNSIRYGDLSAQLTAANLG